jgi:hypothetical protein
VFDARVPREFCPSCPVVLLHQSQCCAQAWGSYACFHCNEVLEFRLVLRFSSGVRAYESVESQTY